MVFGGLKRIQGNLGKDTPVLLSLGQNIPGGLGLFVPEVGLELLHEPVACVDPVQFIDMGLGSLIKRAVRRLKNNVPGTLKVA